jgi:hypothetical protein
MDSDTTSGAGIDNIPYSSPPATMALSALRPFFGHGSRHGQSHGTDMGNEIGPSMGIAMGNRMELNMETSMGFRMGVKMERLSSTLSAKDSSHAPLAGIELRRTRSAVVVTRERVQEPTDKPPGDIAYRHINIAINLLVPSKQVRRR